MTSFQARTQLVPGRLLHLLMPGASVALDQGDCGRRAPASWADRGADQWAPQRVGSGFACSLQVLPYRGDEIG